MDTPIDPLPALEWPPVYTIRHSLRARRIFLQVSPKLGLEVVVPHKRKRFDVLHIINEKRQWIEKMLSKMLAHPLSVAPTEIQAPSLIECPATAERWKIIYIPLKQAKRITLTEFHSVEKTLLIKGNTDNWMAVRRVLIKWLIQYARAQLIPWLKQLSLQTGLHVNHAIIRGQATLWGSCNAKKTISLNYKLLFLPKKLAEHVLLHELCHTKHLNHSTRFWQLFKSFDAEVFENKLALKTAEHYLPDWLRDL